MKKMSFTFLGVIGLWWMAGNLGWAQVPPPDYDPKTFDVTAEGPWSDIEKTTLSVPKVAKGSITLDASVSSAEYGGFVGVPVVPGAGAWNLDYPEDRETNGPDDTSFTFFLAHDDDYFYIGVSAKDDIVNSDDPNNAFWKDDAIELIFDVENWKFDQNYDSNPPDYGGHPYMNWEGRFSDWDDTANARGTRTTYSPANPDWTYGPDGDVFGVGKEVAGGWVLEAKFSKASLTPPDSGIVFDNGYKMGFNIGMDDDDRQGPGPNGSGVRTQDLEIQYFWANRVRAIGWNQDEFDWGFFTEEELANRAWLDPETTPYDLKIDSTGRLTGGGAGDIIFMAATPVEFWSLF
ncbi:MAG TPA: sugar-binding protein [bacterium]|nr:sugar-binding protein [bacterium]HOL94678.1 sugar-binding protein [bacterium]HPO99809.1 sugar-binding protein [bacterium]HXK93692.1 sugar-binding protein [bacterium]